MATSKPGGYKPPYKPPFKPGGSTGPKRPYNPNFRRGGPRRQNEHNINGDIEAAEVRLVGENVEVGVFSLADAMKQADAQGLDLVEISPNAEPPVCRIVDYQKFLYDKKKKEREAKQNSHKQLVKEIRFGPNTDEHDFQFKVKHAKNFLEEGDKVKAYVHFKGRSIAYKERGEIILLKFAQELAEYGKVELLPKLEGNRMFLNLAPLPKKSK
ncbi:MAG: translation initiation factor IF-3 [Bacteroidia bacterium]